MNKQIPLYLAKKHKYKTIFLIKNHLYYFFVNFVLFIFYFLFKLGSESSLNAAQRVVPFIFLTFFIFISFFMKNTFFLRNTCVLVYFFTTLTIGALQAQVVDTKDTNPTPKEWCYTVNSFSVSYGTSNGQRFVTVTWDISFCNGSRTAGSATWYFRPTLTYELVGSPIHVSGDTLVAGTDAYDIVRQMTIDEINR